MVNKIQCGRRVISNLLLLCVILGQRVHRRVCAAAESECASIRSALSAVRLPLDIALRAEPQISLLNAINLQAECGL